SATPAPARSPSATSGRRASRASPRATSTCPRRSTSPAKRRRATCSSAPPCPRCPRRRPPPIPTPPFRNPGNEMTAAVRLVCCVLLLPSLALAEDFAAWEERYQFDCNGPFEHFSPADVKEREGWKFEHTGGTVKVTRAKPRAGKKPVLGLLAGIKDLE